MSSKEPKRNRTRVTFPKENARRDDEGRCARVVIPLLQMYDDAKTRRDGLNAGVSRDEEADRTGLQTTVASSDGWNRIGRRERRGNTKKRAKTRQECATAARKRTQNERGKIGPRLPVLQKSRA